MSVGPQLARMLWRTLAVAMSVVTVGVLTLYVASERIIHRQYDAPLVDIVVPADAESIREGARLARIHGCNDGCHGEQVGGEIWDDGPWEGRAMAPDIALVARQLSTAQVVRIVRQGIRVNGEGVEIMPSNMFHHLTDRDLGKILAFLRQAPVTNRRTYAFNPGPHWRWQLVKGDFLPMPDEIRRMDAKLRVPIPDDAEHLGEYLARTSCPECHGVALEGDGIDTPNLVIVQAYTEEAFIHFMRTGKALGDRELELMSVTARERFSNFTDVEVRALYAYLRRERAH